MLLVNAMEDNVIFNLLHSIPTLHNLPHPLLTLAARTGYTHHQFIKLIQPVFSMEHKQFLGFVFQLKLVETIVQD